jgi:hypothetical protein
MPEAAQQLPEAITNSIGMQLQLLPAGEMEMGLTAEQAQLLVPWQKQSGAKVQRPFKAARFAAW